MTDPFVGHNVVQSAPGQAIPPAGAPVGAPGLEQFAAPGQSVQSPLERTAPPLPQAGQPAPTPVPGSVPAAPAPGQFANPIPPGQSIPAPVLPHAEQVQATQDAADAAAAAEMRQANQSYRQSLPADTRLVRLESFIEEYLAPLLENLAQLPFIHSRLAQVEQAVGGSSALSDVESVLKEIAPEIEKLVGEKVSDEFERLLEEHPRLREIEEKADEGVTALESVRNLFSGLLHHDAPAPVQEAVQEAAPQDVLNQPVPGQPPGQGQQ